MLRELPRFFRAVGQLIARWDGQDLVEYALLAAMVALAATAGMRTLAQDIGNAFTGIGEQLPHFHDDN